MAHGLAKKVFIGVLAIGIVGGLGLGGYTLHTRRAAALEQTPRPAVFPWALRAAAVKNRDLTTGFPVLATLSSQAEVTISPQISGVITDMGPREGEPVAKGALLARLDTQELENDLSALKASLKAAVERAALSKTDLERQQKLLEKGFATREEVDRLTTARRTAVAQVNQLRAQIAALKTRLKYGVIRATADGVVAARLQEPGDLAAPGRAIYRITATTGARIRVTTPQDVATRIRKGAEVRLEYGDDAVSVRISRVFPALDSRSMGAAEADLDEIPFGLPSGARLSGRVVLDSWPGVIVAPRGALILSPDGARATLFRIASRDDGDMLEKVEADIIASGREGVALSGPLQDGDKVAIAQETQLLKLADGDPVVVETVSGR